MSNRIKVLKMDSAKMNHSLVIHTLKGTIIPYKMFVSNLREVNIYTIYFYSNRSYMPFVSYIKTITFYSRFKFSMDKVYCFDNGDNLFVPDPDHNCTLNYSRTHK